MNRPVRKFFIISFVFHALFFIVSGFIFVAPQGASAPIKVSLIDPIVAKQDFPTGRIGQLPEPEKSEIPDKSEILSKFDSKASSPEKGDKHQAKKSAIPREKISPPAPARKKAKKEAPAMKRERPGTKIAALIKNKRQDRLLSEVLIFSKELSKETPDTEKSATFVKSQKEKPEERRRVSAKMTDQPAPEPKDPIQLSGMKTPTGSALDTYAKASTDNVIEMGDEAIVSFSTRSFKYIDYFNLIRKRVELQWSYPEEAIIQGWDGKVMLRFTINNKGELEDVRLLRSSGHEKLTDEAQTAIKKAAPYDPFPPTLNIKRIHIVATFVYQPTFSFIK